MKLILAAALVSALAVFGTATVVAQATPSPVPSFDNTTLSAPTDGVPLIVVKATSFPGLPDIIGNAVAKFPWLGTVLLIVGSLRLLLKPIFSIAHSYVLATASTRDDEIYTKIEQSPITRSLFYVLDWFGSIKAQPVIPVQIKK